MKVCFYWSKVTEHKTQLPASLYSSLAIVAFRGGSFFSRVCHWANVHALTHAHEDTPVHSLLPVTMRSLALCFSFALQCFVLQSASEYSSKSELEYEFGDYRGKFCMDDQGFVYGIGEVYYPSSTACPCTCTEDGPVCVKPKCPRIHPRCTRIKYKSCCPVCEAVSKVCVYGGKTYRVLEEFRVSQRKFLG